MTAPIESSSRLKTWPIVAVLELQQFAGHGVAQAVDAGDAVAHFDDGADFADLELLLEAGDFLFQDAGDFCDVDGHEGLRSWSLVSLGNACACYRAGRLVRSCSRIAWS